jgi:hypothetical protein
MVEWVLRPLTGQPQTTEKMPLVRVAVFEFAKIIAEVLWVVYPPQASLINKAVIPQLTRWVCKKHGE